MKIKWVIFGFIITWLFFSYKEAMSDDWSRKSVGQGVGGFLGVLSTQLMDINNPYALATGGLLGMFLGVSKHRPGECPIRAQRHSLQQLLCSVEPDTP